MVLHSLYTHADSVALALPPCGGGLGGGSAARHGTVKGAASRRGVAAPHLNPPPRRGRRPEWRASPAAGISRAQQKQGLTSTPNLSSSATTQQPCLARSSSVHGFHDAVLSLGPRSRSVMACKGIHCNSAWPEQDQPTPRPRRAAWPGSRPPDGCTAGRSESVTR